VAYAISKFSALPNVALYVDAAHEAWLGWPNNRQLIVGIFQQVLAAAGGASKIRGFSVNVANYFPFQRYANDTVRLSAMPFACF
jgi:cellulose 1,4-beta-cellobiosidase